MKCCPLGFSKSFSHHSPDFLLPRGLTVIPEGQGSVGKALEAHIGLAGVQPHEEAALWGAVEVGLAQPLSSCDPLVFILGKQHQR